MPFKIVIPARYGSTRLPAKPLLDIAGRPMIQWVAEAACRSGADEIIVATDDVRIVRTVEAIQTLRPVRALLTRADHISGTDRIAEVAQMCGWPGSTIVVNVQADEPQLPPALIDQVADLMSAEAHADIATACVPIKDREELMNPNAVKVVCGQDGHALYFSRAPIPYVRDAMENPVQRGFRHLGIYAYRVTALQRLTRMPAGKLEVIEKLEQLRALEAGMRIVVATAVEGAGIGVDTPEDLARLRASLPSP